MNVWAPGPKYWLAVEELNLSYHNMDIRYRIWFLDYGNLTLIPQQQPKYGLKE